MAVLFTVLWCLGYLVLLVFYLRAEAANQGPAGFARATGLKMLLGLLYLLTGVGSVVYLVAAGVQGRELAGYVMAAPGLGAAIAGDYYLQFIRLDEKRFKTGIAAFAITQVFLIVCLYVLYGLGWLEFVLWPVFLGAFLATTRLRKWQLGGAEKLLSLYGALLTFTAAKAIAGAVYHPHPGSILLALGCSLFFASDVLLGFWNYETGKRRHANLNWITFFSGMLLIGLSGSPLFL